MTRKQKRDLRDAAMILIGGAVATIAIFAGGVLAYQSVAHGAESWRDHPCDAGYENCPAEAYPPEVRDRLIPAGGDAYWPPVPSASELPPATSFRQGDDCLFVLLPGSVGGFMVCETARPAWTYDPPLPPRRPDVTPPKPEGASL